MMGCLVVRTIRTSTRQISVWGLIHSGGNSLDDDLPLFDVKLEKSNVSIIEV
jgi:hypothetical protein